MLALPAPADGSAPGYFGVYPAIVTDLVDTDRLGRVEVRFPWLGADGDRDVRSWATLCSPYADDDQGLQVLPEVGSQVIVAFEAGNTARPYILGASWNGQAKLPADPQKANDIRVLRSRGGSRLEFDDARGRPKVSVTTSLGHRIVLDDGAQDVTVRHANGATLHIDITGRVEIRANTSLDVTAPAVNVNAAMSTFSGVVQCTTLIASTVVSSPAYTPGAGNIW